MKPTNTLRNLLALAGTSLLAISYTHAGNTWDGGGLSGNWNTAANWNVDGVPGANQALTFTGDVETITNNDIAAAYNVASISFTNDGSTGKTSAFSLGGLSITTGNITTTANTAGSTITDIISLELIMNGNRIFTTNQLSSSVQHNLTISGIISQSGGSRSLTKQGAGTLTLNGSVSNTFAGGLIVNGGLLALDYANMGTPTDLVASQALTIKGGNLVLMGKTGANATSQTLGNVTVSAGGGTLLIDPNGGTSTTLTLGTFDSATQGASMLVGKALGAGSGTVTITTTTNKNATTGVYRPRFVFTDGTSTGYDWLTTASVGSPYTLSAYSAYSALDTTAGTDTLNSRITADAALGGSRITNTLKIETPAASQSLDLAGNTLTLTGGGLLLTGTNAFEIKDTVTGGKLIGQNGSGSHDLIVHQYNSGGLTISAEIANNGANATALTKAGTGSLTLSGSNTFTGGLFINSGSVTLNNAGALNNSTPGTSENAVTMSNSTTLSLNGQSYTLRSLNSANTTDLNGALVQNAHADAVTLTVGNSANAASNFAGVIQDGSGGGALSLTKSGTNTLTLSGANTFSGGLTMNSGRVAVSSDANMGAAAGSLTFNGGELHISGDFSSARTVNLNAVTGNRILLQGNADWINSGALTGDGGITFRANPNGGVSATLTSLSNDFKGVLGIESGTGGSVIVRLASLADSASANGNIAFGALHATNNQTFEWSTDAGSALTLGNRSFEFAGDGNAVATIKNSHATNAITVNTGLVVSGTGTKTLTLDAVDGPRNAFNGNIGDGSGTVLLKKTGAGDWVLGGTNSYTGGTAITGGGLTFLNTGAKSGSGTHIFNANTMLGLGVSGPSGFTDTDIVNAFAGTMTGNLAGITVATNTNVGIDTTNGDFTLGSNIATTTKQLHKLGDNTLTLTGTNANTGLVIAKQGTLQFGTTASLTSSTAARLAARSGATLAFNVGGGGEFDAAGVTAILNNQTTSSGLSNGMNAGSSLGFDTTNANLGTFTIANVIADTGGTAGGARGLTKLGTGSLVLTNTNTYTGATLVSAGTLEIAATGSTAAGSAFTVTNSGSTLIVNGTVNGSLLANSGTIVSGTGTITGAATIYGTHNPGNSPGIQTFDDNLTYNGAVVNWELSDNTTTNAANPNAVFDQIVVGGDLNFTVATTLNLLFNGGSVLWNDTFWASTQSWTLYDVAGTTTNIGNLSLDDPANWVDSGTNAFNSSSRAGNTFSLSQVDNDVILTYTVVPEPSVVLLGGLGALLIFRRRRA